MYSPACCVVFTATPGAIVTGIICYLSLWPYSWQYNQYYTLSRANKLCCCLLPNSAMGFGSLLFLIQEGTGRYAFHQLGISTVVHFRV